jgi:hypothetical protein
MEFKKYSTFMPFLNSIKQGKKMSIDDLKKESNPFKIFKGTSKNTF